jgi:hypothetical protein
MGRALLFIPIAILLLTGSGSAVRGESKGEMPGESIIGVTVVGSGAVTKSPDLASYPLGSRVTLTAVPAAGHTFYGFTGDVTGPEAEVTVQITSHTLEVVAWMPIFMTADRSIVVRSALPGMDGRDHTLFQFTADLDLPSKPLDQGDGYRVWIIPYTYHLSTRTEGGVTAHYAGSVVLAPHAENVIRGGWVYWHRSDGRTDWTVGGRVATWELAVEKWDADSGVNTEYEKHYFDFTVTAGVPTAGTAKADGARPETGPGAR